MKTSSVGFLNTLARVLFMLALAASGLVQAQVWPGKPVHIIVPISIGGTTDLLARMLGQALSQATGQPFVVDNKAGASGAIGAAEVARAAPDGYTLLVGTTSTHSIAPHVSKLPYNVVDDFTPIALLAEANNVLLASPALPAKNVAELLALARAKPGSINYASSGIGSWGHLAFELFAAQTGVTLSHVPYRGTGSSITDLSSGTVHLALDALPSAMPQVKSGRVRALAVSGPKRSSLAPDVPTISETVPGFAVQSWFGLFGPKGISPDLARRINTEVIKALQSPDMIARFASMGIEPGRGTPAEFAKMVAADSANWSRLVKERSIKLE
jgi:tripartite-type tricarboxylate transporter receptor subunit TctC